jgi:hypothetical protein
LLKGIDQRYNADCTESQSQPVYLFDQVITGSTLFDGVFAMFVGKNQGDTAFGSRGITWSDNLSAFQSGASVVRVVQSSGVEAAGSWCSPSGVSDVSNQNGEGVLGNEVISSKPTNLDGSEWVMNFDANFGENNLWVNNQNPENRTKRETIDEGNSSFFGLSDVKESTGGQSTNKNDDCKISPVTSRAVNVFVRHDGQTTTVAGQVSKDSVTKEGI